MITAYGNLKNVPCSQATFPWKPSTLQNSTELKDQTQPTAVIKEVPIDMTKFTLNSFPVQILMYIFSLPVVLYYAKLIDRWCLCISPIKSPLFREIWKKQLKKIGMKKSIKRITNRVWNTDDVNHCSLTFKGFGQTLKM